MKKVKPLLKRKKHDKIINDFNKQKSKHVEKLATQMLKKDEQFQKLKEKKIDTNFLKLF
jgi:ribosome recycling factor